MCGIVGYAGRRDALPILLDGLKRLEYRGYDSAGVAIVGSGLQVVKDKGFIANLEAQLPPLKGSTGFAHTRWATHGAPSKVNAHPHVDCTGKIALAHNGTIEQYEGRVVDREPQRITWSLEDAEKGGFEHFMLKEIHEAPQAIHETLRGRLANLEVDGFLSEGVTSVKLVACGTSYHAALVGKYVIEEIARIPASAELASEYRYSQGATERPLVLLISQSGETADTLGAAREAHRRGCKTLAICNVIGSSLSREVDKTIYTRAGIEIGVAATKTFIAELVVLYLIALKLGQDRGTLGYDELDRLKDQLRSLPRAAQYVLNKADEIRALAQKYGAEAKDMFYIGRHANYPVAMEGALKIKEISYIHAEAYAAGELKHGPLALLTSSTPVIAIVAQDPTYEKMRSNVGEVSARGSPVLAIGTEGDKELPKFVDDVIEVPSIPWIFSPVPVSVALQLFAYEAARMRDCPIDKPRNLAKSVTVE